MLAGGSRQQEREWAAQGGEAIGLEQATPGHFIALLLARTRAQKEEQALASQPMSTYDTDPRAG
jgi:hypothetical protein